jgi:hypothetical protein
MLLLTDRRAGSHVSHGVRLVWAFGLVLFSAACDAPNAMPPREASAAPDPPALASSPSPPPAAAEAPRREETPPRSAAPPDLTAFGGVDGAYPWPRNGDYEPLAERFAAPPEAVRVELDAGGYSHWLRHLPLRPRGTPVLGYHGRTILDGSDRRLGAVVDLDLIGADLQQCADTVLRLRAEYLRASGEADRIAFHFVSGFYSRWADYRKGTRIRLVDGGRRVEPYGGGRADDSRQAFEGYLRDLFSYASTISLAREAKPVAEIAVGDFFILPGGPGHTVMVVDLARGADGQTYGLLAQGFMPAQDLHVLRASAASPWYRLDPGEPVDTPMWEPFPWASLRRLE